MESTSNSYSGMQLLITRNPPAGFFSNYFYVLEGILEARKLGLHPVVGFPVNNSKRNTRSLTVSERWSDYFEVTEKDTASARQEAYENLYSHYRGTLFDLSIEEISAFAKREMPLTPKVKKEFALERDLMLGGKSGYRTLGVHFRSGDMQWHPRHPTPPSTRQMIDLVIETLGSFSFDNVFVATDTPKFVRLLRSSVELPVLTIQHRRLVNLGWSNKDSVRNVLLDAYLLAACEGLVHSSSNVSLAARVLRGEKFNPRVEINLGSNPKSLVKSVIRSLIRFATPLRLRREPIVVTTETIDG